MSTTETTTTPKLAYSVYEACAALNPTDYRAPRPSFFGSIHATLNHILVGDRVWMGRLEAGQQCPVSGGAARSEVPVQ